MKTVRNVLWRRVPVCCDTMGWLGPGYWWLILMLIMRLDGHTMAAYRALSLSPHRQAAAYVHYVLKLAF